MVIDMPRGICTTFKALELPSNILSSSMSLERPQRRMSLVVDRIQYFMTQIRHQTGTQNLWNLRAGGSIPLVIT